MYQINHKTAEYVLRYDSQSSLNVVFGALRSIRRQTRLPMDKRINPMVVSQYIRDGTWELKSVLVAIDSTWRNHPTTPRQLPGLKTPEHVSILDL